MSSPVQKLGGHIPPSPHKPGPWLFAPQCVILLAHPVCDESHIQRNANKEVATIPIVSLLFIMLKQNKHCLSVSQNMR